MPSWKKVIISGSNAALNTLTVSNGITGSLFGTSSWANNARTASFVTTAQTASYVLNAISASFASTASSVNTLNQNVLITGSLTVGSSSSGASENTLTLGARDNGGEGGQLGFNASGGTYTSASMIDNYQNRVRILRGTNAGSDAEFFSLNLHSGQAILNRYTGSGAFPGTAAATLAVDSSGNVITIAGSGGGTVTQVNTSGTVNGITLTGGPIITSGTVTLGGTLSNVQSSQLATSSIMIGNSSVSLGATASSLTGLTSVSATSFTGSLQGTASYALQAVTASYALTSSFSLAASANTILVINKSGATISKGMVVHLTGSNNSSDTPYVITASYENDSLSANTLGIASETIAFNNTGYITTEGVLTGINVTGFTSGQVLYLGPTGSIIGSAPVAPLHGVRLGQVVRDSPSNNGAIYVRVDNGYELGELHDVVDTSTTSSYGALLVRSGSVWTNSRQLTGSYGLTGSLQATSFTGSLFGTASWAVTASNITPAITNSSDNRVLTDNGDGTINGESNLTFDGTLLGVTGQLRQGDGSAVAAGNYSHAQGDSSEAQGNFSHAEGAWTIAYGYASHAEGYYTTASGDYSHAEGEYTYARGHYSHAEGSSTTAFGDYSHAEGKATQAIGDYSHAEGEYTYARGNTSHTEGYYTTASGNYSHAEGDSTLASGSYSHAEGYGSIASGSWSHAEGYQSTAIGGYSHAEGRDTVASGGYSHAEGRLSIASGDYSHAEGATAQAIGEYSHAEGANTQAIGSYSHAEGINTQAIGQYSHAEGSGSRALGEVSHAEGFGTLASGSWSHAEGLYTTSSGVYSHAEGQLTIASGSFSHAEGGSTQATGQYSHAEGGGTQAIGQYSHAEGGSTQATGTYSHAEGQQTIAIGQYSHAEGRQTTSSGDYSHAEGFNTVASGSYQHVQGQFNISSSAQSAFIIGNGTANGSRSNLVFASGSIFQVTGSVLATQGFTGSLFGTSSWAVSASFAISSSRAVTSSFAVTSSNALTASFVTSSNVFGPNGSNSILSASFAISSSRAVTSSFAISSSNALTASFAISSSRAVTSSFAISSSNALTSSFLGSTTNAFIQNGNSFGTTALLGTNDNNPLALETNGTTRMFISSSGDVGIGTASPAVRLDVQTTGTVQTSILGRGSDGNFRLTTRQDVSANTDGSVIGELGIDYTTTRNSAIRFHRGGSTTGGFISFTTDAGSERVRINSTGNVGIQTTDPVDKLDVNGSIRFRLNTPNFTATPNSGVLDFIPTSIFPTDPQIRLAAVGTPTIGASIAFQTGINSGSITERMRITPSGSVGISVTAPDTKLHIEDVTKVLTNNVAGVAQGTLSLVSTDAQAANVGASLVFGGNYINSSNTRIAYAGITGRKDNSSSVNADGYLSFLTWRSTGLTEAMRITPAGRLGINTTAPSRTLDVNGDSRLKGIIVGSTAPGAGQSGGNLTIAQYEPGTGHNVFQFYTISNTDGDNFGQATLEIDPETGTAITQYNSPGTTGSAVTLTQSVLTLAGVGSTIIQHTSNRNNILKGGIDYDAGLNSSQVNGEMAYWGGGSVTAGNVYFYSSTGNWVLADADAAVSSSGMLGIAQATGTASTVGMLLRGQARFTGVTSFTGTTTVGAPLYVSQTAGAFTQTAPTGTGKVVRIIGYVQSTANDQIYFCPDTTWVELV